MQYKLLSYQPNKWQEHHSHIVTLMSHTVVVCEAIRTTLRPQLSGSLVFVPRVTSNCHCAIIQFLDLHGVSFVWSLLHSLVISIMIDHYSSPVYMSSLFVILALCLATLAPINNQSIHQSTNQWFSSSYHWFRVIGLMDPCLSVWSINQFISFSSSWYLFDDCVNSSFISYRCFFVFSNVASLDATFACLSPLSTLSFIFTISYA
jgi:hypothetical protein